MLSEQDIIELTEIVQGRYNDANSTTKKLFISTGIAIQDALIASFLYNKMKSDKKVGSLVA